MFPVPHEDNSCDCLRSGPKLKFAMSSCTWSCIQLSNWVTHDISHCYRRRDIFHDSHAEVTQVNYLEQVYPSLLPARLVTSASNKKSLRTAQTVYLQNRYEVEHNCYYSWTSSAKSIDSQTQSITSSPWAWKPWLSVKNTRVPHNSETTVFLCPIGSSDN